MQRETHTEWKERGRERKEKVTWHRVSGWESEKSEGDANAEREADKTLVMECERGRLGG